jgi:hypothetical protein
MEWICMTREENTLIIEGMTGHEGKIEISGFDENKEIKIASKDALVENYYYLTTEQVKELVGWFQRELKRADK